MATELSFVSEKSSPGGRSDDVGPHATPVEPSTGAHHLNLRALVAHAPQERVVRQGSFGVPGDKDGRDLEGVEDTEKPADMSASGLLTVYPPF
jgi:hypothetical protein